MGNHAANDHPITAPSALATHSHYTRNVLLHIGSFVAISSNEWHSHCYVAKGLHIYLYMCVLGKSSVYNNSVLQHSLGL